jgi:negative regulator of flagellin synthesis FlgM
MQVYGPAHLHAAQNISAPHNNRLNSVAPASTRGIDTADTLEISSEGMFVEQTKNLPEMRMDRVAALRAQIANGTYETPDKLDLALENLLDELA